MFVLATCDKYWLRFIDTGFVCAVYVTVTFAMDFSRVPTGQRKLEKVREFEWSGKGQRKIFFRKVRENEKLVPPDVRFLG